MLIRSALVNARRLGAQAPLLSVRHFTKISMGAPPQRFLSPTEGVLRFLAVCVAMLAYPTYVLMNLDNVRPRQPNELSDEMNEYLQERREARARGERGVLLVQPWKAEKQE
ncbi:hypothetical protein DdX_03330 [Ditylenchus destructor]|uniref:Uncharacterized protein n=1 Tax=Ditylenchus destructor TaxID=166010 RepID=A0AAD4NE57_9BILA|nr:hypothetical protein DdX_03330 [Ditylenchus destructor]